MTHRSLLRRRSGSRGVALIEAAIILPFLVVLVLGIVESGFAYRDGNVLARATQQAARSDARVADGSTADYEALRALDTGLSGISSSTVKKVIVYRVTAGITDKPPAVCLGKARPDDDSIVGHPNQCNVYSRTQLKSDDPGRFGCGPNAWDRNFCPTSDRVRSGNNPTKIGVWVELSFDQVTKILPASMSLTRAAIYQLEPCIAGDPTC